VDLAAAVALLKDRAETLEQLAEAALLFCKPYQPAPAELAEQHLTPAAREALADFAQRARGADWTKDAISALIKTVLAERGLKMPQLAIPLRVAVVGQTQTPAVDAVLALIGKDTVLQRLDAVAAA
jgi:glutamyl-tRNA synthetase